MNHAGIWSGVLRVFALLLPDASESWVDAIRAELYAIPAGAEQRRYALSSMRGLAVMSASRSLRRWGSHARELVLAALVGFTIAAIDMTSQTRLPLLVGLIGGCAAMGLAAPSVSRLSGTILGLSFPALAALLGVRAQYPTDLAHSWIPLLPAVALTSLFGWLRARYRSLGRA